MLCTNPIYNNVMKKNTKCHEENPATMSPDRIALCIPGEVNLNLFDPSSFCFFHRAERSIDEDIKWKRHLRQV